MSNVSPTAFFRLEPKLLEATIVMVNTIMQSSEEIILHYLYLTKGTAFILSEIDHFHASATFCNASSGINIYVFFAMSFDLNVQVSVRTKFAS